jgi:phosphoglycolate phosphatase
MLKPIGKQVCIIPISKGYYDESNGDIGPDERLRRFGQHDHVRSFGVEDLSSQLGKVIRLPAVFDAEARFGAERLTQAGVPKPAWSGFNINTVLEIGKGDYLLCRASPEL